MAQQFSTTGWADGVTSPHLADYNKIVADLAKRGVSIDGGGYGRVNTGYLLLLAGDLPGTSYTVTAASWTGGVAMLTIGAHNIAVNQRVSVSGAVPTGYNSGTDSVPITAVTSTTISYALTANPGTWTSGGIVLVNATAAFNGMLALGPSGAPSVYIAGSWATFLTSPVSAVGPDLTLNSWLDISASVAGFALLGNNCYLKESDNSFRYTNTHASLGASGVAIGIGSPGAIGLFTNPGAATAGSAFTPTYAMMITSAGKVGINKNAPNSRFAVSGLPTYASDSAAGTGGLTTGDFYVDSGGGVHMKL